MHCCRFDECGENGMGPGTDEIHTRGGDVTVMGPLVDHFHNLFVVLYVPLCAVLQKSLPFVLSDLQFGLPTGVQQIVNCLIVDLHVLTFDLKFNFIDALVLEHSLIVEVLFASRGSLRAGWATIATALGQHMLILDLANLGE